MATHTFAKLTLKCVEVAKKEESQKKIQYSERWLQTTSPYLSPLDKKNRGGIIKPWDIAHYKKWQKKAVNRPEVRGNVHIDFKLSVVPLF